MSATPAASARRRLRWGVLGYARIAREQVMPAIQRSENSTLHALASREPAKLTEAAARFPGVTLHQGYAALLDDPTVDAVYLPLPNSQHHEWALRAIERGKHVLCEKPIALDAAQCAAMIAAARARGVVLMEAFMYRYTPRTRRVLEVLRSGELGEIRQVSSTFRFLLSNPASIKLRPELGGGSLYDVGCYPVNFIGLVADAMAGGAPGAGGQPEAIVADCVRHETGIDLGFAAVLRYPSGLLATLNSGFDALRRNSSEIVGAKGTLEVPETFMETAEPLVLTTAAGRREIEVPACDRYRLEVEDFADAVQQGRPPHVSLVETQRNTEVIDRLLAAAGLRGAPAR